jgi:hypothetical protein
MSPPSQAEIGAGWHDSYQFPEFAPRCPSGRRPLVVFYESWPKTLAANVGVIMTDGEYQPVAVTRRICAPAHDIFEVLANPVRHLELDGSGSLRGAASTTMISGVGDIFVMKMYFAHLGDYEMNNHVVEYEQDRRIGWEPEAGRGHPAAAPDGSEPSRWGHRWSYQLTPDGPDATVVTEIYDCSRAPAEERAGMDDGNVWAEAMASTLERLDALCAQPARP